MRFEMKVDENLLHINLIVCHIDHDMFSMAKHHNIHDHFRSVLDYEDGEELFLYNPFHNIPI